MTDEKQLVRHYAAAKQEVSHWLAQTGAPGFINGLSACGQALVSKKSSTARELKMPFDLAASLPLLIPKAIEWAEQRAAEMLAAGRPLTEPEIAIARRVGVMKPEDIRLFFAAELPQPADLLLRRASIETGLLGADTAGLTLGHAVYIRQGHSSTRLLSHEFRHVHQYEMAGSIALYLPEYLRQIVQFGYTDAPHEVDARAHEIRE